MALELFATLTAVALLGPQRLPSRSGQDCSIVLPGAGDNMGAAQVVARGLSTKYPLSLIAMEMAARLEASGARLDALWVPRDQNQEADDLSNGLTEAFDPALRVGSASGDCIPLIVLPTLQAAAERFHREASAKPEARALRRAKKGEKLRDREPW